MKEENRKDRRLLKENTLIVPPTLAQVVGLDGAIVLQQIHYWLEIAKENRNEKNYKDGHYWTFNSAQNWQKQFPWWSVDKVKRTIKNLERQQLIVTGRFNSWNLDRTKWYRINYEALQALIESRLRKSAQSGEALFYHDCANLHNALGTGAPAIPNNNSSDTSKKYIGSLNGKLKKYLPSKDLPPISFNDFKKENRINKEVGEVVKYFLRQYKHIFGKVHVKLKTETWVNVINTLFYVVDEDYDLDPDCIKAMIDRYFEKAKAGKYKAKNFYITHFNNPEIKKNLYYERDICE